MNNVTAQNVLDVLEEKDKELAGNFKRLETDLEEHLKKLKEKSKEKQKQPNKNNQLNSTLYEPSELTKQFVSLLDRLTKQELYQFRPLLISKYKPKLPKHDQSKLKDLIEQKDQENGFKELLEANPVLKLEHENKEIYKDFSKLKNQESPSPKLGEIVAHKVMYHFSNLTSEQKDFLLNEVIQTFDDKKIRNDIFESVNNRPKESMAKLQMIYPHVYEQFMKLKTLEDFEHVGRVVTMIKKCDDLDLKDEKALIDDLDKRKANFGEAEKNLHYSKKELKNSNSDVHKQFLVAETLPQHLQDRVIEKIKNNLTLSSETKEILLADLNKRINPVVKKQQENTKAENLEKGVDKTRRKTRIAFLVNAATQTAQDNNSKEKPTTQNQQIEKPTTQNQQKEK